MPKHGTPGLTRPIDFGPLVAVPQIALTGRNRPRHSLPDIALPWRAMGMRPLVPIAGLTLPRPA